MNSHRQNGLVLKRLAAALKRTLDEHCDATTDTYADIAAECGISASYLSNMATGATHLPMDIGATVMRVTGRRYIGIEFARTMGDMWIGSPCSNVEYAEVATVLKEVGDVVAAVGEAKADGRVAPVELPNLLQQIAEAQEALGNLAASLKAEASAPIASGTM